MSYGLTLRQAKLLELLQQFAGNGTTMPSYDEIAKHLGLKSKSNIGAMLDRLAERGYIRRLKRRAVAIELIASLPVGEGKPVAPGVPVAGLCPHCLYPIGSAACLSAAKLARSPRTLALRRTLPVARLDRVVAAEVDTRGGAAP